jgi:predicted nucleic acid-binding protein
VSQPVTVDASVFVNAFSPAESGSDQALEYIDQLRKENVPIIVPALLLPEVTAAIARKQSNTELALQLMNGIRDLPNITLIDLDKSLAELSSELAAQYRLRGSDAVYAAVALRFTTHLVTLDRQQLERLVDAVPISSF